MCHKENVYGIVLSEKLHIKLNVLGLPIKRKNRTHGNNVCVRIVESQ